MDVKNGIEPVQDSNNPLPTIEKSDKKLESAASSFSSASTISSASISSSDDPFEDISEDVVIMPDNAGPSKSSKSLSDDDDLPESTLPDNTVQFSPPVQTMERSGEPAAAPSTYRIPSSVFARTKSNAPEWSVASNESLFSIHMGNMSFSRDHLILMGRSGELGLFKSGELVRPGDLRSGELVKPVNLKSGELVMKPVEATTSSQFMNYTNNQAPVYQTTDIGRRSNMNLSPSVEASAFETMKEVLKENEADFNERKSSVAKGTNVLSTTGSSHRSDGSGNSSKNFAFPILTGAGDKGSSRKNGLIKSQFRQESYHPPEPSSQPQTQPAAKPETAAAQTTSWLSCFSCCPFRR